ncbi:MAG: amidohydrolase family protein [Candidatus Baltobacteraceae bacterium]
MAGIDLALTGGKVYASPADASPRDATILVRGGAIAGVGADLAEFSDAIEVLDCRGLTILAGFWNCHVHFFERKWAGAASAPAAELAAQLEEFTRFGFTSVFDLSSNWENTRALRARIDSGEVLGPSIYSTGEGLVPPGALPPPDVLRVLGLMETPLPEVADAAQAERAARSLLERGVDGIKLFMSSQHGKRLERETIRAATRLAQHSGKPVFAHPNDEADVAAAVQGGVDVIAHTTPRSGPWSEAMLEAMRQRDVALIPTLLLWDRTMRHDRLGARRALVDTAVAQLAAWLARDGNLLFGTDLGAVDPDPSREYALMAQAGAGFARILDSLTTAPARRFGAVQLGAVVAGHQADLVVLDADPSQRLDALTAVRYTLRAGRVVYRAAKASRA